jgi:predicted phosphodiesterase
VRVGIFTDIHGNLPALEALIVQFQTEKVERIYFMGDAVGLGPYPGEVLDLLNELPNFHPVCGNHDWWAYHGLPHPIPEGFSGIKHRLWTAEQLSSKQKDILASWPIKREEIFEGTNVSFLHYSFKEEVRFSDIIHEMEIEQAYDLFQFCRGELVFYGHHHPFSDLSGERRFVNPGASGCSSSPEAKYCIGTFEKGKYFLEYKTVPYDASGLLAEMKNRKMKDLKYVLPRFFPNF